MNIEPVEETKDDDWILKLGLFIDRKFQRLNPTYDW